MISYAVLAYFLVGLLFISIWETATHGVTSKIDRIARENQTQMMNLTANMGQAAPITFRVSKVLTLVFLWLTWPTLAIALAGKVFKKGEK